VENDNSRALKVENSALKIKNSSIKADATVLRELLAKYEQIEPSELLNKRMRTLDAKESQLSEGIEEKHDAFNRIENEREDLENTAESLLTSNSLTPAAPFDHWYITDHPKHSRDEIDDEIISEEMETMASKLEMALNMALLIIAFAKMSVSSSETIPAEIGLFIIIYKYRHGISILKRC
jgi:hypothetical protein